MNGSNNIQVGQQVVNYSGLTVDDAVRIANNLFENNFPNLKEVARDTARKTAEEFFNSLSNKLKNHSHEKLDAFNQPALQYALYQGIKNFVRYPDQQKQDLITDIIVERVLQNDSEVSLKVAIDKAIETAALLNQDQLDYLTLVFLVKNLKVSFGNVKELNDYFKAIANVFANVSNISFHYLNYLGCFELHLGSASSIVKSNYPQFDAASIKVPEIFNVVPGDYGVSYMGRVLCLTNVRKKLNLNVRLEKILK